MRSNRLPQFNQPQSVRIADAPVLQGAFGSLPDGGRCGIGWLAYRHGNDRMPGCTTAVGLCQNVHGVKGLNCAAAGKSDHHYLQKIANVAF